MYPAVTRPYTRAVWAVYTAGRPTYRTVYTFPDGKLWPCAARYGIRSVYAAVYTARVDERVHGCVWDVYTTVYMAPYGAMYTVATCRLGPCTRTCTWRVHGLITAVYTYACVHGCVHGRERALSELVDGHVRSVYRDAGLVHGSCAVCYYDFLCERHLLCRIIQLQIHYIQKELGQLALLAPRCRGQQYHVQC